MSKELPYLRTKSTVQLFMNPRLSDLNLHPKLSLAYKFRNLLDGVYDVALLLGYFVLLVLLEYSKAGLGDAM